MRTLTERQAYEAVIHFLDHFVQFTGSKDITDVLSGGEYTAEDEPADSAFWHYWQDAVDKVLSGAEPIRKRWL